SLVAMDHEVDVLDNFQTGRRENLSLSGKVRNLYFQDVSDPLSRAPDYDRIYHLACPASPVHYQSDPVHTFKTAVFWNISHA
ncbi:NAD-dependent epimerase/dehydratase family protein, partial [mine drainage metagenome]